MLILAAILLVSASSDAALVTVRHEGTGSGLVSGGTINCGEVCSEEIPNGGSATLTFTPDDTGADLLGWGGMCAQYERRKTCTVTVNSANDQRFQGAYPVVFVTGFWQGGVCRGEKPAGGLLYFQSLQEAWDGAQAGTITPRIECSSDFQQLSPTGTTAVTVSGGWGDLTPNELPEPGAMTLVAGPLVISTAPLIVGGDSVNGNGGIAIVGGWRYMTGPVVISNEPMIIPNSQYDLGVIIK